MGQSHSQPSGVRQHDQANVIAGPQRESSTADASSPQRDTAAPVPRRRTPSSGAPRKRLSTLLRGKRPASTIDPSFNERGEPLNTVDRGEFWLTQRSLVNAHQSHFPYPDISVPPLSVKSSLRRLFNRRSWAPSGLHGSRDPSATSPYGEAGQQPEGSHPSRTANSSRDTSLGVTPESGLSQRDAAGLLSSTGVQPTMEGGSLSSPLNASRATPSTSEQVSSSVSPSNTPPVLLEGNNHTARRAPTKREIAMLSGTSSPDSGNTPTRGLSTSSDPPSTPSATVASTDPSSDPASDAPVSPVLEEDPAALGLSRPASWHSFTHEDSHEADLATLDGISVAEVGEENKHATSEDPIFTPEESPLDMDLRSDIGEASHPRSSAVEPGSIAPPMSDLTSSITSLPPNSTLPMVNENTDTTGLVQPIPPSQPAIVPPLPVIPAGTTMIIQGVVQAAEDPARPPRRRPDPPTPNSEPATNGEGSSDATVDTPSNAPASNAHARLPGTFGEEAEAARRSSQDAENPSGAAELLGALLL